MLILYSFALLLVLAVGAPWWLFRMATSGKYREGLTERLGFVPRRVRECVAGASVLWIHAVSVGEVLAASSLIEELTRKLAEREGRWRVVVSTTTRTGQKLARERFGSDRVFYFPLDFAFPVRAWLRALCPRVLVLAETEFWPRMLTECRRASVPVTVVNARISDRSWPKYRRLAGLWKRLLRGLAVVLAQTPLDAERLQALGAPNVRVGGNLKFDVRATQPAPASAALRERIPPEVRILVCGSTLSGEEEMLLDAMPDDVVMILAPRHPERFEAVAQLLRRHGSPWLRRSAWIEHPTPIAPGTVFLLDSIGELASVYSLAELAFVGGSLLPYGGHNPLEPAQFGVAILTGPSYENFRGIVETLRAQNAIRIVEPDELRDALAGMLADSASSRAMGERARRVFESEAGATSRAVNAILNLLEGPA